MTAITVKDASGNTQTVNILPAPGQAASAASLPVVVASDQSNLPTAPVAGENHLGSIGGETVIAPATLTRTSSTTAYASGQLIGNNATAGASTATPIPAARKNGGTGSIRRARVSTTRTNGTGSDVIRVHLYKGSAAGVGPATTAADGGTFAGTTNVVGAVYLGYFDVTLATLGTDGAKGNGIPATGGEINFDTYAGQNTLYYFLEARSAFTPVAGETITVTLEVLSN